MIKSSKRRRITARKLPSGDAKLIARLRKHQLVIAKERDALRDTVAEYQDVLDGCARAHDDLDCAIDALSELQ